MSNLPSDTSRSFRRDRVRISMVTGAENGAGVDLRLRDEEQAFELPAQLFEELPFASMGA